MSKGEYKPGDPSLFSITTKSPEYARPADVEIVVKSFDPRIKAVRVRIFAPGADTLLARAVFSDSVSWGKNGTGGRVLKAFSRHRPPGFYKIVANTKKEAWIDQDISGLLFFGEVLIK